jgi:decaprenylphospho-beta-D-ribofuranose 2-oxidase
LLSTRRIRSRDLTETIALFDEHEPSYQYSVAWVDCLARGNHVGRAVLMFGNHAERPTHSRVARGLPSSSRLKVPVDLPAWLLNPTSLRAFNSLYYTVAARSTDAFEHYDGFFYPLDFLSDWNRLYGRRGLIQYQCVLPAESSNAVLHQLLALFGDHGQGSFLAVLKRFGRGRGWLSFPINGYTLSLDLPVRAGLLELLDRADQLVAAEGGRVYLAKDARMSAGLFEEMYPELPAWCSVKQRVDPRGIFASSLSRRIGLTR